MKFGRLIALTLVAFGTVHLLKYHSPLVLPSALADSPPSANAPAALPASAPAKPSALEAPAFRCEGKRYCSQMGSRAEAEFYLAQCPGTRMDGDGDGIPCENDSRW
ncbi:excalibur calcium-binding domain-containing protein [Gallaecimonas xiamenensis]|uniref:Excalibur domain-containing protein n=1 Tax=Gallaecimonas xiamenensis 3-C-1 TaxID=745411 RepID=K2J7M5_9GAMM|nr:excalibur calcium-binding domain-containing protein [Gallaecimonas xiamenensis]EKE70937.1 excalibur domain-containing protein [Gallaecimonas xiamenensis 3-C-1]